MIVAGSTVPLAATRIYEMSFFTGFGVSALIYWVLNWLFPACGAMHTFQEIDMSQDHGPATEYYDQGSEEQSDEKEAEQDGTVRIHTIPV